MEGNIFVVGKVNQPHAHFSNATEIYMDTPAY